MTKKETKETIAVISALWWARYNLMYNTTFSQWKNYCSILDRDIEFFLKP